MSPHEVPHRGSAEDWLQHAGSDLCLAQVRSDHKGILLETLCFHAQQAAEKALKAVLLSANVEFPRTHSIRTLVESLPDGVYRDPVLDEAAVLTEYAVATRYPSELEPLIEEEYEEAVAMAAAVLKWAQEIVGR